MSPSLACMSQQSQCVVGLGQAGPDAVSGPSSYFQHRHRIISLLRGAQHLVQQERGKGVPFQAPPWQ